MLNLIKKAKFICGISTGIETNVCIMYKSNTECIFGYGDLYSLVQKTYLNNELIDVSIYKTYDARKAHLVFDEFENNHVDIENKFE